MGKVKKETEATAEITIYMQYSNLQSQLRLLLLLVLHCCLWIPVWRYTPKFWKRRKLPMEAGGSQAARGESLNLV